MQSATNGASPAPPAIRPAPATPKGTRKILLEGSAGFVPAAVYDRDALAAGQVISGPAIVEQRDTTTLIEPGWQAATAHNGVLILTREARP